MKIYQTHCGLRDLTPPLPSSPSDRVCSVPMNASHSGFVLAVALSTVKGEKKVFHVRLQLTIPLLPS